METLRIDCATCRVRGPACGDCLMTALLGPVAEVVELAADEAGALRAMAESGLLPPLRLVRPVVLPGRRGVQPLGTGLPFLDEAL